MAPNAKFRLPTPNVADLAKPCKLKTLLVWGLRGEAYRYYRPTQETADCDISVLRSPAGSSRFRTNGTGVKATFIYYCKLLGIKTDFGACEAAELGCWNTRYIQERNFDYGEYDARSYPVYGSDLSLLPPEAPPKFAAIGYLAERHCSECSRTVESHMCRECEDARSCYNCKKYVCSTCDPYFEFATLPDSPRPLTTHSVIPNSYRQTIPRQMCRSRSCNKCVLAGRYICMACDTATTEKFASAVEAGDRIMCECEDSDFCPISIPIDRRGKRSKRHLTTCGVDGCDTLIMGCNVCKLGKRRTKTISTRCSACALPLCEVGFISIQGCLSYQDTTC